jgi:hypothetical protein
MKTGTVAVSLCCPLILYGLLCYQTGLLNTVVMAGFWMLFSGYGRGIFGQFPGLFLGSTQGNVFLTSFSLFYFYYYLLFP